MDQNELVDAIKQLVADGEYLDEIPGIPGAHLEGGGAFRGDRRLYWRGTPEFLEARAAGLTDRLPPPRPPASMTAVEHAEELVGAPLPALLRRLYLEVANGGFGPGYGILGLDDGHGDDYRQTAVDLYRSWRVELLEGHEQLFHVCYWGCAIYSLIDCTTPDGTMWGWDPNPAPDDDRQKALFRQSIQLREWLERWLACRLYQPALVEDPITGEWRGATDEEYAQWAVEAQQ